MNLIQIQERLKEVPLNAVIAYANGSNPEIPPYLALAEVQRRNSVEEKSQRAEPPDSSVKEQIERKAMEQSATQMMADQARQQQASQQMAQQMAQPRQEIPEGVPQPEQPETVPAYASGGITGIPVSNSLFNFDKGGIVSFADGEFIDLTSKKDKPKEEQKTRSANPPKQAKAPPPKDYMAMAEELINKEVPMPESPAAMLEKAKLANPELARPIGEDYMGKLQALEKQDLANREAFEEREKAAQRRDFWNSLIAAGEATRGGGGIGSLLGGFGRSYSAGQEAADERRARQEALRREQDMNMAKLNFEVQNLRRAEARGDVDAAYKHQAEIAKIEAEIQKNKIAGLTDLARTQQTGKYYDIIGRQAGQQSQPELARLFNFFKQLYPTMSTDKLVEMAKSATRGGMALEGAESKIDAKTMEDINKLSNVAAKRVELMGAKDPAERQRIEQELNEMIMNEINRRNRVPGGIAAPQATPSGKVPGYNITREQ